jgi:primosomal protein N'
MLRAVARARLRSVLATVADVLPTLARSVRGSIDVDPVQLL